MARPRREGRDALDRYSRWLRSTWFLAVVVTVMSARGIVPVRAGLDPSWHVGLQMASERGLDFGDDVVFTCGPLGFLLSPLFTSVRTAALAFAYGAAVQLALVFLIIRSLRRALSLPLAVLATFLVVHSSTAVLVDAVVVPAFFVAVVAVLRGDWTQHRAWLFPLFGAIAGAHLLIKFNTGIGMVGLGGLCAVTAGRGRRLFACASFGTAGALAFLVGWVVSGNPFDAIGRFISLSIEIGSGYSEAMSLADPERRYELWLAAAVVVTIACLVGVCMRGASRLHRAGVALTGAWLAYVSFKYGFVRHRGHSVTFFIAALIATTAFPLPRRHGYPFLAALTILFGLVLQADASAPLSDVADPLAGSSRIGDAVKQLASPARRTESLASNEMALRAEYGLDAVTVGLIAGRELHIEPWEASVAWAYPQSRWDPLPVFQSPSAYTKALDDANAARLRGPNAPPLILRHLGAINNVNPAWATPASMTEFFCRYREAHLDVARTTGRRGRYRWQVLERGTNRCERGRTITVVETSVGRLVRVPAGDPRSLVLARISGLSEGVAHRLVTQAWRAEPVYVVTANTRRFRLVPGTASSGLVVRAPAQLAYSKPFAPPSVDAFRVVGGGLGLGHKLSIEFVAVPMRE